jgi:hypothetical protein
VHSSYPPRTPDGSAGGCRDERLGRFLGLSVTLTGFNRVELLGTGMAARYLGVLEESLSGEVLDGLLAAYAHVSSSSVDETAFSSAILADERLGPVARNLILLWYCGTWTALPASWQADHGSSDLDADRVVSAEAYQQGLQWVVAGAHPMGARQQGYGAWSVPPDGGER